MKLYMPRLPQAVLVSFLLSRAVLGEAPPQLASTDLLIYVSSEEAADIVAFNDSRDTKLDLYFADEYQIAIINDSAIRNRGELRLNLPGLKSAPILRTDEPANPESDVFSFIGWMSVEGKDLGKYQVTQQNEAGDMVPVDSLSVLKTLVGANVTFTRFDIDKVNGSVFPSQLGLTAGTLSQSDSERGSRAIERRAFLSAYSDIDLSFYRLGKYRIRPLPRTPKYHLIIRENDRSVDSNGNSHQRWDDLSESDAQKIRDFHAYADSLAPDDPRLRQRAVEEIE